MRSTFRGLALVAEKTVMGNPRFRADQAIPWPKFPAVAQVR